MARSHVIDGVTYVEVDRYAKEGDKIISKLTEYVFDVILGGLHGKAFTQGGGYISKENYNVLEPLESEEVTVDSTQASEQVFEMLANLARRVTQLESQLADTQRNLERQAEDLENAKHRIDKQGGWLIKNTVRLDKAEELVEMLTDDIVTLDSRSQVLNAINKYYAEGRR
jgi:DNA repair ATPase RecN